MKLNMLKLGSSFILLVILFTTHATADDEHIILEGECLWKIAEIYGTDWPYIADYNNLKNPNLIYTGNTFHQKSL